MPGHVFCHFSKTLTLGFWIDFWIAPLLSGGDSERLRAWTEAPGAERRVHVCWRASGYRALGREPYIGLPFASPSRPARGHTAVVSRYQPKSAPDPGRPSNRRGAISFSKSWVELLFRAQLQAECGEAYSRFCESWFGLPFRARLRAELGGQSDFITQEVSRHCQGEFEGG